MAEGLFKMTMKKRRDGRCRLACFTRRAGTSLVFVSCAMAASLSAAQGAPPPLPDPFPSTYRPMPRVDTLIEHATILDGAGHRLENSSLLLRDGKVAGIGSNLEASSDAKVIDAAGRWVTPGLIDVHSHIGDFPTPFTLQDAKHSDVNEETNPDTAQVWALHSIRVQDPQWERERAGGVTVLQILPGSSNLFGGRGVVVKNIPAVTVQQMEYPDAMPSLKMACGENPKETYGDRGQFPSSEMGNVAGYRQAWIDAEEYMHAWDAYEAKHDPSLPPPHRDLKLETLAAVLRGQILVVMHCYRADEMAVVMDVAKEFHYQVTAFHHAVEAYKIVDLLKANGVCVAVWPDWWGFKNEAWDAIPWNAVIAMRKGVRVAIKSDSEDYNRRLNQEAAKTIRYGGATEEEALRMITLNAAWIIGIDDRVGSIDVGKDADLVIWDGYPLSSFGVPEKVFIDGELYFDRTQPGLGTTHYKEGE